MGDRVQGMILTPMVLCKDSNFGPLRGLVNMSAFWLSVLINSKHTIFSSTKSRMKCYRISTCFDFECWTGFFDRFMALMLSQNTHIVSWVFHNLVRASSSIIVVHNNSPLQCIQLQPLIERLNFDFCSSITPNYFQDRNNHLKCSSYHQCTRPSQHPNIQLSTHLSFLNTKFHS